MTRFVEYYSLGPDLDYRSLRSQFAWRIPARSNIAGRIFDAHGDSNRPAIVTTQGDAPGETWTFSRLVSTAKRYGQLFRGLGITRGDRIGVVMPQSPELAAVHLATYAVGAIAVPMSALYGPSTSRHVLGDSGAVALVTDEVHAVRLRSLRGDLPDLRHVIVRGRAESGELALADASGMSEELDPVDTDSDDPALLLYTSGSTGRPKGVLHAHRVLEGYLLTFRLFFGPDFDEPSVFYTPSDWAWVGGLLDILLPALLLGYPVVADDGRFSVDRTYRILADHQVTHAFFTPTALKMLTQFPHPRQEFELAMRMIASGGEAVPWSLYRWASDELDATISEFYGLTEVNHLAGGSPLWPPRRGSMGLPYPGREVAVVDQSGSPVAPGSVGEIAVRPGDPTQMLGYWNNEAATEERFRNGWIMTGDLARANADGYLYFEGRRDDMINSAGYRIGPVEVEETLLEHPAVAEAAVIGSPDSLRGEIVKALVVPEAGHLADENLITDLKALVKERLAAYKYPRAIEFVTDLPKTTTGKINRSLLREASNEDDFSRMEE